MANFKIARVLLRKNLLRSKVADESVISSVKSTPEKPLESKQIKSSRKLGELIAPLHKLNNKVPLSSTKKCVKTTKKPGRPKKAKQFGRPPKISASKFAVSDAEVYSEDEDEDDLSVEIDSFESSPIKTTKSRSKNTATKTKRTAVKIKKSKVSETIKVTRSTRSNTVYTSPKKTAKKIASKPGRRKNDVRLERMKTLMKAGGCVEGLPGRTDEFDWIKRTVLGLLDSSLGGCLYISGVPGTGKTATTHRTLDALTLASLRGECQDFDFCEINGMRLSDPAQAYSILAKTILPSNKSKVPSSGALSLKRLESHFKLREKNKTPGRPCIVLLDELDLLLRKRQSILYHFFEWPNWANSQLIVITIANTMDLPERFLSNRISSRLGLTRYNFKPYDHLALATIIEHQLKDYVQFLGKDAIQLCARKVSAVSGDARRAVNLAKRAIDYFRSCSQEELMERTTGKLVEKVAAGSEMTAVNLRLMDLVLRDALLANPVQVISQLSKHQRLMLLSAVLTRKKLEDEHGLKGLTKIIGTSSKQSSGAPLTLNRLLEQHFQLCRTHQFHPLPSLQELYGLLESLEALRLLRCCKFRESGPESIIQLLVHEEDIKKGLGDDQALKKYLRD